MIKNRSISMKNSILLIILLTIVIAGISGCISQQNLQNQGQASHSYSKKTYSSSIELLGNTSYGAVIKEGPYGNVYSSVKIAYIVGVHPLESNAHKAVVESIKTNDKSLKYCYYIYRVIVTKDADDYEEGRMNGQLLAYNYVVPDIKNKKFQLAVDIHSNGGNYQEKRFVFTPVGGNRGESIALNIKDRISWLVYYIPPSQTSPPYVTIPLITAGIPAILYETYMYEPYEITKKHADEFVLTVDSIDF